MSRAEQQIRELLGPLDPMRHDERGAVPPPDLDAAGLTDIGEPAGTVRPAGRRRSLLAAAAAAAVLVAGGLAWNALGPSTPKGFAATPPPLTIIPAADGRPAKAVLEAIADAAAASGVPAGGPGQTEYHKMRNWHLSSQVDSRGTVSAIQPEQYEAWLRPDNSRRQVTRKAPPEFQSDHDREQWDAETEGSERVHEGSNSGDWKDRPPTDLDALRVRLAGNRPVDLMGSVAYVDGIGDLLRDRVLLPAERAAVLRVLADLPGIRHDGQTRDRTGRPGQAFSVDTAGHGLPARYTFVIDPAAGLILAEEEMLTTDPGLLNVRVPAVIGYETYLTAEFLP